ncbi:AAA family ATPase [Corynebacterium choanae]|uniref:Proteasome-associated ATPase n=1 Tax=Corynebacterium choanae TaxID=1862358 RepID=A0A3G6J6J7_9CORY|nr:AAA family ATPase [Corynebacterium choanae]AZA13569.1 Proteasome-associated ATPase [Corynebacterium choanae]
MAYRDDVFDAGGSTAQLSAEIQRLSRQNQKLVELLRASRAELAGNNGSHTSTGSAASTPNSGGQYRLETGANTLENGTVSAPSLYGIVMTDACPTTRRVDVYTSSRRQELSIDPGVDPVTVTAGTLVRLGDKSAIVATCGLPDTGELFTVDALLDRCHAVISDKTGTSHVVTLALPLRGHHSDSVDTWDAPSAGDATQHPLRPVEPGDTVIADIRALVALKVHARSDIATWQLTDIPEVSYDHIGGLAAAQQQLRQAVELPVTHPQLVADYQLTPCQGVLLYGPPGCGKTMLAKAVAHQLAASNHGQAVFLNIRGPELLNKYVGETERLIRLIFARARRLARSGDPVIIFFDEMEATFRARGSGISSDVETTVVPQLLAELDGVEALTNVIVIGATNREDLLDPAIVRPGRFDVKIAVPRPTQVDATAIVRRALPTRALLAEPADLLAEEVATTIFRDYPLAELTTASGEKLVIHARDLLSGALLVSIVNRAKLAGLTQRLDGAPGLITRDMLIQAVTTEFADPTLLPNPEQLQAWAHIHLFEQATFTSITRFPSPPACC